MKTSYQLFNCPKRLSTDPNRFIEVDTDNSMYLTTEFPTNRVVLWKSLINQAGLCFQFRSERQPEKGIGIAFHERIYQNAAGMDVVFSNDFIDQTITICIRMPMSGKVIDVFNNITEFSVTGYCQRLKQIVQISLADNSLEDEIV